MATTKPPEITKERSEMPKHPDIRKERPEMPERFLNGGASAAERILWITENWPDDPEAQKKE